MSTIGQRMLERLRMDEARDAIEQRERAAYTGPGGAYVARRPSDEALADLLARASNEYGEWVKETPSGYWLDLVEMAREVVEARARGKR